MKIGFQFHIFTTLGSCVLRFSWSGALEEFHGGGRLSSPSGHEQHSDISCSAGTTLMVSLGPLGTGVLSEPKGVQETSTTMCTVSLPNWSPRNFKSKIGTWPMTCFTLALSSHFFLWNDFKISDIWRELCGLVRESFNNNLTINVCQCSWSD